MIAQMLIGLRHYGKAANRTGLLKFVDLAAQRNNGQVNGEFFTAIVRKAWHAREIKSLIAEAERRFDPVPWQLLASAAHVSSGQKVNDPKLASELLFRIEPRHMPSVREGVVRSVLGNASKHRLPDIALKTFQLLREISPLTITDYSRVIHAGLLDQSLEAELLREAMRIPCPPNIDERAIGVFLKAAQRRMDMNLGMDIWRWIGPMRSAALHDMNDASRLVHPVIQLLLLCGQTGNAKIAKNVIWKECQLLGIGTNQKIMGAMLAVFSLHGDAQATTEFLANHVALESITPPMLVSALTAYAHAGETSNALALFESLSNSSSVSVDAFTALIDGFARKGDFTTALRLIDDVQNKKQFLLDDVVWMTILSPCRHHKRLDIAKRAFDEVMRTGRSEHQASAYVLLADVYRACGDVESATKLQQERLEKGLVKARGAVTVTVNGRQHVFHVGSIPNELMHEKESILKKLDEWAVLLAARGVQTSSIQCRHSEKLALAYAVLQKSKMVVMRKNLRVCSVCHEASRELTLVEDIVIHHWDNSRVHIMKDGKCSCNGHY